MGLVGNRWVNCFRTHNELTMGLLGKYPLAPSDTLEATEALDVFCSAVFSATSQCSASAKLANICDSLPPSVFDPYSVFQLVSLLVSVLLP